MSYWLIKTILVIGLLAVAYLMMRPVRTANHLAIRRLGVVVVIVIASLAVIFPDVLTQLARSIGVYSSVNLLVYILVLAVFTQMAIGYRRDTATDRKLTQLARTVALLSAPKPPRGPSAAAEHRDEVPLDE